jgi:hypothetical protein
MLDCGLLSGGVLGGNGSFAAWTGRGPACG